jgi:hypothetical protein
MNLCALKNCFVKKYEMTIKNHSLFKKVNEKKEKQILNFYFLLLIKFKNACLSF